MCNSVCDTPVKVRAAKEYWEFMTLEQLYVRCVTKHKKITKDVDALLVDLKIILRRECYEHLLSLVEYPSRLQFVNKCIDKHLSPFGVRMLVEKGIDRTDKCYWPECPS